MRKLILFFALLFSSTAMMAQTFDPEVVINGLKDDVKFRSLQNERVGILGDIRLPLIVRTPSLQFTFTQVVKDNGEWKLTQPFTVGYSYIYTLANGVLHPDSSMTIENKFFFGAGANFGMRTSDNGNLEGSVPVGAILGYSRFGVFGGIDLINQKPIVGVTVNILNFPLLRGTTRFSLRENN